MCVTITHKTLFNMCADVPLCYNNPLSMYQCVASTHSVCQTYPFAGNSEGPGDKAIVILIHLSNS